MDSDEIKMVEREFQEILRKVEKDTFASIVKQISDTQPLSIEEKAYFVDRDKNAARTFIRVVEAFNGYLRLSNQIIGKRATPDEIEFYFVKLWILLTDAVAYFQDFLQLAAKLKGVMKIDDNYNAHITEVVKCLESLQDKLTPDELLAIEYLRINACHLYANKYYVQSTKDGKFALYEKDTESFRPTLQRKVTKILTEAGSLEAFAVTIIGKTTPCAKILFESLHKWQELDIVP